MASSGVVQRQCRSTMEFPARTVLGASIALLLLVAPTQIRAANPWPKSEQERVLDACRSAGKADAGVCACTLAAVMPRWPDSNDFWRALDTQDGKIEFIFWIRECRVTQDIRARAAKHFSSALGARWSPVAPRGRVALGRAGYRVDAAFVRGAVGQVADAPGIVTIRVSPEVVGQNPFVQSMQEADQLALCVDGARTPEAIPQVEEVRFDARRLTYWCEWSIEDSSAGPMRSIYAWQWHQSHLIVLDGMIRPNKSPLGSSEVRRAFRQVIAQLVEGDEGSAQPRNRVGRAGVKE